MITSVSEFLLISFWAACIMGIYVMLYRKHIFSLYDPLLFFLLTNTFTTVLMFMQVDAVQHLVYFIFCQIALWLGITNFKYKLDKYEIINFSKFNIKLLKNTIYVLFIIYIVANLYAASRVGFPIFNDNPTAAKSSVYVGGLGIVRRINWGASIFLSCACFIMLFISKTKRSFIFILLCQVIFTILSGSKGGLLSFLFMLAYIISRPGFQVRINFSTSRKYKKFLKYILLTGLAVAITVLYKEKGNLTTALFGLYNRLLLSGDVILYYYQKDILTYFRNNYSALDFIPHELNPVLGLFRLTEYKFPFGYEMIKLHLQSTGENIPTIPIGPNTQFFIKGHVFFSFVGGVIYSLFVGLLIGFLRKSFFVTKSFSLIRFTFSYAFVVLAFTYAIESNLFISQIFDMFIFVFPILVLCFGFLKYMEAAKGIHEEENSYLGN